MKLPFIVCPLVKTHVSVALARNKQNLRVRVIMRNQHTRAVVHILLLQRLAHVCRVPDKHLPSRRTRKARGDQFRGVSKPNNAGSFDTLVRRRFRDRLFGTGVKDPDHLVLGDGGHQRAVPVPCDPLDDFSESCECVLFFSFCDVPEFDGHVGCGGREDVFRGRVEKHMADFFAVSVNAERVRTVKDVVKNQTNPERVTSGLLISSVSPPSGIFQIMACPQQSFQLVSALNADIPEIVKVPWCPPIPTRQCNH